MHGAHVGELVALAGGAGQRVAPGLPTVKVTAAHHAGRRVRQAHRVQGRVLGAPTRHRAHANAGKCGEFVPEYGELVKVFAELRAGHGACSFWHHNGEGVIQLKASRTSSASCQRRRSRTI